jgi:hypothetical protein
MGYNAPGNIQYNYAQLEGIWCQAGGDPGAAPIAAAIAMAESGGNTTATNQDSNGTVDRGLWQINSVHGAQSTYDVMGNARAAKAISNNGQSWAPWTTYTNGAYRQYVKTNVPADTSAPINATNAAANATDAGIHLPGGIWDPANWFLDPFGSAGSAAGSAASAIGGPLIKYFMQGLLVTIINPFLAIFAGVLGLSAGAAMVVIGIFMMVKNTEAGQEAGRAAGTAAQAGMTLAAPESKAATTYLGQSGQATTVTQARKAPGTIKVGGRPIQYRPGRVRTTVEREGARSYGDTYIAPGTRDQLVNEANGYNNRKQPKQ